jgi:ribosome-binding ATPase YchF (GTP1/OBG family)
VTTQKYVMKLNKWKKNNVVFHDFETIFRKSRFLSFQNLTEIKVDAQNKLFQLKKRRFLQKEYFSEKRKHGNSEIWIQFTIASAEK